MFDWVLMVFHEPSLMAISTYGDQIQNEKSFEFDHHSILNQLPDKFKSGSVCIDYGDTLLYFAVYFGACLFFYILYQFWRIVFEGIKFKEYEEKDKQEKVFFLILWTSQAHHVFVPCYALYNIYNSCQNEYGEMNPNGDYSSESDNKSWWSSPICRLEVNKGYVYNILICIAFMTVEFMLIHFKI